MVMSPSSVEEWIVIAQQECNFPIEIFWSVMVRITLLLKFFDYGKKKLITQLLHLYSSQ